MFGYMIYRIIFLYNKMNVVKRKGNKEPVNFSKIQKRIEFLKNNPYPLDNVNEFELSQMVIQGLYDNIHTTQIDEYTSEMCASLSSIHYEYGILGGRFAVDNHHKNTEQYFFDKVKRLYFRKDAKGDAYPLLSEEFYKFVKKNHSMIARAIKYERDYLFDYFGFKTLENGYLLRIDNEIIERPQDLFMRVAVAIHMNSYTDPNLCLEKIFKTYDNLSLRYYTHATPTLFNAGTVRGQCSSCFLLGSADSSHGITKTISDCAEISKWSGGIGFHLSSWRGRGSHIRGTNGYSSGSIPFLRIFNAVGRAFNQGGGKRKGSIAAYIEMHHLDIMDFLNLRRNHGDEELRCRDLFLALWVSDLFMERVLNDEEWSLFCPDECPRLNETFGDEYRALYEQYEREGKAKTRVRAREVWRAVFDSQKESGVPYICYKDTVNRANMQENIGVVQSSNLCSEIMLVSNTKEYAVCNLASLCLPRFVEDSYTPEELELEEGKRRVLNHEFPVNPIFNYKKLGEVTMDLVYNLNRVIDRTWNPTAETARSNFRNRPIGIGIQGLADVFLKFRCSFESDLARDLNQTISETIYYYATMSSTKIARDIYQQAITTMETTGKPYKPNLFPKEVKAQFPELKREELKTVYEKMEDIPRTLGAYHTYDGSPWSRGKFHWELYGEIYPDAVQPSGMYDWEDLRAHIGVYGVRNSVLVAYMPTASTSQIMGCSSCFEPYTSNLYRRKTLAGDFIIVNKYLVRDLESYGVWNDQIRNYLLQNEGSIQQITGIPDKIKEIYKTVWEIRQSAIIKLSSDRQPFIDQSQSMNLYLQDFTFSKFNSMQFFAWNHKLKTGCYYMRTRPAINPQKFTIDPETQRKMEQEVLSRQESIPTVDDTDECLMCSG